MKREKTCKLVKSLILNVGRPNLGMKPGKGRTTNLQNALVTYVHMLGAFVVVFGEERTVKYKFGSLVTQILVISRTFVFFVSLIVSVNASDTIEAVKY